MLRVLVLVCLFSCSREVTHGVIVKKEDIGVIIPNVARKADVLSLLGSPSFEWKNDWYYISTKKRYKAFFLPKVLEHNAVVVKFEENLVREVLQFSEKDIQTVNVEISEIKKQKPNLKEVFNS